MVATGGLDTFGLRRGVFRFLYNGGSGRGAEGSGPDGLVEEVE